MRNKYLSLCISALLSVPVWAQHNALPKKPSIHTILYNDSIRYRAGLNFNNTSDSVNAWRGAIATWPGLEITIPGTSKTAWDMKKFSFLTSYPGKRSPQSVNPSLWRQAKLNYTPGIFQVSANIYQARGFDLSNITFVRGQSGWIVIDPLVTQAAAKAAIDSINSVLKTKLRASAIIFTHSHIDHYGGVTGIAGARQIPIYAPSGFLEHAVSENTIAGNVMGRRAAYMYGSLYPKDTLQMVDAGLGKGLSSDTSGLLNNTIGINAGILQPDTLMVDGVSIHFWCTPGAEAPVEMMFYFPADQALCASEEVTHTMHNVYSLRGARVRDALAWSKFIDSTLTVYGGQSNVIFASHHWPVWGSANVQYLLKVQRDLYRYMHDQTMRLANQGYTATEIAEQVQLPKTLDTVWANRGYYGTLSHNTKSVVDYYLGGWFDGNPANLHPLPPREAGAKYVEFMGGRDSVLQKAQRSYNKGEYRWAATVLNHLVFADSGFMPARYLLADTYEQLGYQAESGPWRNFYLTGAQELRFRRLPYTAVNQYPTNEVMNQMPLDQYLDFMAIHLVAERAGSQKMIFEVLFDDTKTWPYRMFIFLENGVMNYRITGMNDAIAEIATDAKVQLPRNLMDTIITRGPAVSVPAMRQAVNTGKASLTGAKPDKWYQFIGMLQEFQFWFNIVLP